MVCVLHGSHCFPLLPVIESVSYLNLTILPDHSLSEIKSMLVLTDRLSNAALSIIVALLAIGLIVWSVHLSS